MENTRINFSELPWHGKTLTPPPELPAISDEILAKGILECVEHGYDVDWEFSTKCYVQGDMLMLNGDCVCGVEQYGIGWSLTKPE